MPPSGTPTAIVGQIFHAIDGQPCVEAVRFGFSFAPPLKQRYGFAGYIGTQKGQAGSRIQLTFAAPAGKAQFNLIALAAQQRAGDLGFFYDFWEGQVASSNHWLITNCFLGEFGMSNDPESGDTERTCTIMGAPPRLIG